MDAALFAVALVALAAYVAAPLYRTGAAPQSPDTAELKARRDALMSELRELRVDHEAGLVDDDDHTERRDRLEREAARVLRALSETD